MPRNGVYFSEHGHFPALEERVGTDRNDAAETPSKTPSWRLGIAGLGAAFARGALSPADALDACLARLDAVNPVLNAVIAQDRDAAHTAARASAERWRLGQALGPLDGVPMVIKDSIVMRGLPTTWGSRLFADFVADADELPVARLRAAGAVLVGKTNVPELTFSGHTTNGLFGTTRNPWNPALTPGGSSGGSVAAVAAGIVPGALGTDGGGSIRRPCALTGLVGLKPTVGRVARFGGLPVMLADLEVVGPIARTVADVAAIYAVIAGPDPRDRASGAFAAPAPVDLDRAPEPLRILYVPRFGESPVDPGIAAAAAEAARALAGLGHRVQEGPPPFDPDDFAAAWPVISQSGAAWVVRNRAWEGAVDPATAAAIRNGRGFTATDYAEAMDRFRRLRVAVGAAFEDWDVIVTPCSAALPWPAAETHPAEIDGRPASPRDHAAFTGFANAAGNPAIAVPCAPAPSGLPAGIQIVGRMGAEDLLLRLAARFEKAMPPAAVPTMPGGGSLVG